MIHRFESIVTFKQRLAKAAMSETLISDRIYIGSNSVAQWFLTLGMAEGRPCLVAHQVFIDAPKQMNLVARQLAGGRLFFSVKQLELVMQMRHALEVSLASGDRVRIERHLQEARKATA
jgi:hypothetical protein